MEYKYLLEQQKKNENYEPEDADSKWGKEPFEYFYIIEYSAEESDERTNAHMFGYDAKSNCLHNHSGLGIEYYDEVRQYCDELDIECQAIKTFNYNGWYEANKPKRMHVKFTVGPLTGNEAVLFKLRFSDAIFNWK